MLAGSFAVCLGIGLVGGVLFAVVGHKLLAHGIGAGLFIVGTLVLCMALLGATEPPEGWATRRKGAPAGPAGRSSLAARIATDHSGTDGVSSLALAVWGIAVGGSLIALSMLAFNLAAR